MTPYWLLFGLWLTGTVLFARAPQSVNSRRVFTVVCVLTALMIGLRYQVGGDWEPYLHIYETIYFQPLIPALSVSDPGYAFANWLATRMEIGIWLPNLICGVLFVGGVGRLAARQPQPWLAMLIAVPYFIIVVAMGYTRQAAAIGIVCFALADATEKNAVRTVVLIGLAALFHKTAVLMLPIALGPIALRKVFTAILGAIAFAILFAILLRSQADQMISAYAQSTYDSQGAGIRIAMNALAGGTYFLLRKRMEFNRYENTLWFLVSSLTFVSIVALFNLSASSGVDRMSLFLIPLQMVVFSRFPEALSTSAKQVPSALIGVIAYCFSVQFVWLNFAQNSHAWVPYSTVILPAENY